MKLASKHQDTVAGLPKPLALKHTEVVPLCAIGSQSEKASLVQALFALHAEATKQLNELCGFENVFNIKTLVAQLQSHYSKPSTYREGLLWSKDKKSAFPIEFEFAPTHQDSVGGFQDDELNASLAGLSASDKATMLKALLADGAGDSVGDIYDADDPDSIGATIRRQGRMDRRGMRQDAKSQRLGARLASRQEAKEARTAGVVPYDDGENFSDQEGRFWRRGAQNKILPMVNANSTAGGQISLANAASATLQGSPTMEVEITRVSIRVEGGATNVEIQETLIASISITSCKIGSIELVIGSGGVEFPDANASQVNPPFWENLVVTGGNSNFTITCYNNGATQLFTVTSYCKVVTRMD